MLLLRKQEAKGALGGLALAFTQRASAVGDSVLLDKDPGALYAEGWVLREIAANLTVAHDLLGLHMEAPDGAGFGRAKEDWQSLSDHEREFVQEIVEVFAREATEHLPFAQQREALKDFDAVVNLLRQWG